jgi:hypothetical protein
MNNSISKLIILTLFVLFNVNNAHSQTNCNNFPLPAIRVTIASTFQSSGISIGNLPAGATSSITAVSIPNGLDQVYSVKMQLNGCASEKLIRYSINRNYVEKYAATCSRIVNVATGKVMEVVGNSQAENAPIRLATPNGSANQIWQQVYDFNPGEGFISKSSGKWLTLNGAPCADGTTLKQTTNKFLTAQRLSNITSGKLRTYDNSCTKYLKADSLTTNIVVGTNDGTDRYNWRVETATCPVVNCPPLSPIVGSSTACVGVPIQLTGPAVKENAAWFVSDANVVAKINSDGIVTGLRVGTVTVKFEVIEGGCLNSVTKTITFTDCRVPITIDAAKCYRISNPYSKQSLEVLASSTANGAQIDQAPASTGANQLWQIKKLTDGTYNIISKSSGKAMVVPNCLDGALPQQVMASGVTNQKWRLEDRGFNTYRFANVTCNKAIRGNISTNIVDLGGDAAGPIDYDWVISEATCPTTTPPPPTTVFSSTLCYSLTARHSSKIMEIATNSTANLINIQQGTWASLPRQVWRIKSVAGSAGVFYTLVNGFSGKVADVEQDLTTDGANILQYNGNGGTNQQWRFDKNTEGYYVVSAKHSDKAIDVKAASTANGANIQQYTKSGGTNQQWTVASVACPTGVVPLISAQIYTADGYREGRKSILTWVSNAADADYFTVEKLNKNGEFETLDRVNAQSARVISDKNYYNYADNQTLDGENTYRITLVTDNAPPQYSHLISLNFNKATDFNLFPNPTNGYLDIDLTAYENRVVNLSVIDATGRTVFSSSIEKAGKTQRIDLNNNETGLYILRLQTAGKRDVTRLFNILR